MKNSKHTAPANPKIEIFSCPDGEVTQRAIKAARESLAMMKEDPDFEAIFIHPLLGGQSRNCGLWLKDGRNINALVSALDVLGNWTVVLRDGGTRQYLADEVL